MLGLSENIWGRQAAPWEHVSQNMQPTGDHLQQSENTEWTKAPTTQPKRQQCWPERTTSGKGQSARQSQFTLFWHIKLTGYLVRFDVQSFRQLQQRQAMINAVMYR